MEKTCNGCKTMSCVTMSSADWQRNEQRHDRRDKRLLVALIVTVALFFLSNAIWLWTWTQYDYSSVETTYTQDGMGTNIIGDGNKVSGADINDTEKNAN